MKPKKLLEQHLSPLGFWAFSVGTSIGWSVLGFLFFRWILRRDESRRFGSSIIVWVVLLAMVLFIALIWMRQSLFATNRAFVDSVEDYYTTGEHTTQQGEAYVEQQLARMQEDNTRTILMGTGMFAFALVIMLTNHFYLAARSRESQRAATIDAMTGVKNKHAYLLKEAELTKHIGAGHASLGTLSRLPMDALKLDGDMIRSAFEEDGERETVELMLDIARHLHVPVVAQGVESKAQYAALRGLGCAMAQGGCLSQSVPAEDFAGLLSAPMA